MELRPGLTYDAATDRLTLDGIPFSVGMLADFIAALRSGHRVGPVFLERSEEKIVFKSLDILDVQLIPMRRERDRLVWS